MFVRRSAYERLFKSPEFMRYPPEERAALLRLEQEALELSLHRRIESREQRHLASLRAREARQLHRIKARELRVNAIEIYFRTLITAVLVLILAATIIFGIVKGIPAGDLTQYLTPISGLAGIAIGYFFGRTSPHSAKQNNDTSDTENS